MQPSSKLDGMGDGDMIRDADDDIVSAGRGKLDHVLDPFQAEVVACLQGVHVVVDMGIRHAIVETYALQVV